MFYFSLPIFILIIVGAIVFALRRARSSGSHAFAGKEDVVSEACFLLTSFFLGTALLAINRDFRDPIPWEHIILIASLVGLAIAYRYRVVYTLLFSLLGLLTWWITRAMEWSSVIRGVRDINGMGIIVGMLLIALICYVGGRIHEYITKGKRFSFVYLILGLLMLTSILIFFSTQLGLDVLDSTTQGQSIIASWQLSISLLLFLIILFIGIGYGLAHRLIFLQEVGGMVIIVSVFGILLVMGLQDIFQLSDYPRKLSSVGVVWAIIFNTLAFLEPLGLILAGHTRKESWLINWGAFFLFLLIFIKYFDWFFSFLDKSVFFISAGLLFFGVGWLMERGRRYMLESMKSQ